MYRLSIFRSQTCLGSRLLVFTVERLMLMLLHKSGPTDDSRLILPRPLTSETYWILCLLHTVKAVLPALFRLYAVVAFTNQPRAQQLFSAAVSPHPAECVGWLAAPAGTGKSLQRSAHSTFAICRPADYLPLELWLTSLRCKEGPYAVVVETQDRSNEASMV